MALEDWLRRMSPWRGYRHTGGWPELTPPTVRPSGPATFTRHADGVPRGVCPECQHPWSEHAGSGNDLDGVCGECAYEVEHGQRESPEPGCRLPATLSDA